MQPKKLRNHIYAILEKDALGPTLGLLCIMKKELEKVSKSYTKLASDMGQYMGQVGKEMGKKYAPVGIEKLDPYLRAWQNKKDQVPEPIRNKIDSTFHRWGWDKVMPALKNKKKKPAAKHKAKKKQHTR